MNISDTITRAAKIAGSQKALAELLGEKESSLSAFKKGRPCSYQKHAQIAAAVGLKEDAVRILIEGMAQSLDEQSEHEAQAKLALISMLKAFPRETDESPN